MLCLFALACGGAPGAPGQPGGPGGTPGSEGADGRSGPVNINLGRSAPAADTLEKVEKNEPKAEKQEEGELNGPYTPPEYPVTVYRPYIRRANTPAPALPPAKNECHIAAEVINYDGVDGCGILLETDAGNLFALGARPSGDPLESGTRIVFGYEYMKDDEVSNCLNADAVIRITCKRLVRVSSGVPRPVICEAYDKPSQWLHDLAVGQAATYITRFPWKDDRYVYLVETPDGQYLYDCRGYLICKPRKNCLSFIEDVSQGQIIWEG